MSFTTRQLTLPGSGKMNQHLFRTCSRCESERAPEGGVTLTEQRWICAVCWNKKAISLSRKTK